MKTFKNVQNRKHKSGGKKCTKNKISAIKIDFLNVRGLSSEIHEINNHICKESASIFGMVETFLKTDERPPVLDDNILNSRLDEHERLWILSRIGNVKTALGVVYFPNDGVNKPITDSLMLEFLENCTEFSQLGYETLLMGDFNLNSYNGNRLRQFVEASELRVANCLRSVVTAYTREYFNNQKSTIDYVLLSNNLSENVTQVLVDEHGTFDLHSDHVIIRLNIKVNRTENKLKPEPKYIRKINDQTDWDSFRDTLQRHQEIYGNEINSTSDINEIWSQWKNCIDKSASKSIGKAKKTDRYRDFWDKELDKLIKERCECNRLKRIHNTTRDSNSESGKCISQVYQIRKRKVQEAFKRK
jgi:hypothetical protein